MTGFRGNCQPAGTLPRQGPTYTPSAVEKQVHAKETQLGLDCITYEKFENVLKRYGYVGRIQDVGLKEIESEINLNFKKLDTNHNPVNMFYRAKRCFDKGNYDVFHLLVLGYLNSQHLTD